MNVIQRNELGTLAEHFEDECLVLVVFVRLDRLEELQHSFVLCRGSCDAPTEGRTQTGASNSTQSHNEMRLRVLGEQNAVRGRHQQVTQKLAKQFSTRLILTAIETACELTQQREQRDYEYSTKQTVSHLLEHVGIEEAVLDLARHFGIVQQTVPKHLCDFGQQRQSVLSESLKHLSSQEYVLL